MSYNIKGKTVLITGANRGIGKAFVGTFIEHGAAKIYAAVRKLESAAPLVEKHGAKVVPIFIDMEQPQSILDAAENATDVDFVVSNAGILNVATPFDEHAISAFEQEMNVNVYGLMRMAQAFAPVLKANGGGVFAQLNSVASMKSFAGFATYSASKAAAYSITQALRELLEEQGTKVLSIHPGPIATDMADSAGIGEIGEPPSLVPESVLQALQAGEFHVFPGAMAKQVGGVYESFAENIVEANLMEE